jgi:hypothetical protein
MCVVVVYKKPFLLQKLMDHERFLDTLENLHERLTSLENSVGFRLEAGKSHRNHNYYVTETKNPHNERNTVYYIINNFIANSGDIAVNTTDVFNALTILVDSIHETDGNWLKKLGKMLVRNLGFIDLDQLTRLVNRNGRYSRAMKSQIGVLIIAIRLGHTSSYI